MKPFLLNLTNGWYPNNNPRSEKGYANRPPINFLSIFLALLMIAVTWELFFGYEPNALTIEDIAATLTPEQLKAYRASQAAVDEKFDDCIQYILYAYKNGKYLCLSCPSGIPFVTLEAGDIWYIGHTCQKGEARHTLSFQIKNGVWLFVNYRGSKQECNTVELKLIRGYKYLPESELKHTIDMEAKGAALLQWMLVIRPLHDALIEDAFDKVGNQFSDQKKKTEWSFWVKFLRRILR